MKMGKKYGLIKEIQEAADPCPECGGTLEINSGCTLCSQCGFSPCG